jgi:hypothetical protein
MCSGYLMHCRLEEPEVNHVYLDFVGTNVKNVVVVVVVVVLFNVRRSEGGAI